MIRTEKLTMLAVGFCGVTSLLLAACGESDQGNDNEKASVSSPGDEAAGSIDLALKLASGQSIEVPAHKLGHPALGHVAGEGQGARLAVERHHRAHEVVVRQ